MRTAYSISGALLAYAALLAAASSVSLPNGGRVSAKSVGARTVFTLAGAAHPITTPRDPFVAPNSPVVNLTLVAQTKGAVVVRDSYESKSGSMKYCQAGSEEYLRVLTTSGVPRETFHLKLASCRENLELSDPGVKWDSDKGLLSLDWLNAGEGRAKHASYRISPLGLVT